ncbi:MAG: hypothetical protein LCH58_09255 [Bacteroidetes bacterium]|uniref:hypothetical protein n=1 Tax=Phnomibacter sp. TaxID=2836217 RepID=UPI002FDDBB20|nr:hypothetical protein [Bacteroidota bacterium]
MKKAKFPAIAAFRHYKVFALLCIVGLLFNASGFSQIGIGSNPHPSAILDLSNSGRGFLLPRLSSGQRDSIANPAIGLVIFNTSTKTLNSYTALGWMEKQGTLIGRIAGLNEQPAQHQGNLYAETEVIGISTVISYTGGNGGTYHAMNVASSGVQGLIAQLAAGSFAQGNGTLTFQITGTPLSTGIAQFAFNIGGRSTTFSRTVTKKAEYPAGTVHCLPGGAAIVEVTNPVTGRTWMDRNLGASNVARWATDATSFGDLYQWGRLSDGHQCRANTTTRFEWSTSDTPGHSSFIGINTGMQFLPGWNATLDWRVPQNDNLWQGVDGINNPCPSGFRLPTQNEWDAEVQSWSANDTTGAFSSPLKLPAAGFKTATFATIQSGVFSYWVSTTNGYGVGASGGIRSSGASVRCIKDNGAQPAGSISSLVCPGSAITGRLTAFQPAGDVFQAFTYTGGNGGVHNGQAVASTGVTGLTATVSPGSFTNGNGALVYRISGTPLGRGTASFSLSIGGQSCTLQYIVAGNPAVIAGGLDCAGAEHLGGLYSGTAAADSTLTIIRYTRGNGGTYETQAVASTGVTGLTATLSAWRLASGDSSLSFVISGTPTSAGVASFAISVGGKTCTFNRNVNPPLAVVSSLNCAGATHAGVLVDGTTAVNAASIINYSGGNGGIVIAQSVPSTGVAGLTATLTQGNINEGGGTISIQISGTPSSAGIAHFVINLGGQSCILSRKVFATAKVEALNCDAVVNRGVLSSGVAASGVSFTVSYTGGNGGAHAGQTATSTGVTGLTATLFPDSLSVGTGVLPYYISGTAASEGTAHFALAIGGSTCTVSVSVAPTPVYASGTVHCLPGGTPVVDVTNPRTGRTWMDRNLGASEKAVNGHYQSNAVGDLYQWGRAADGHQCRESNITSTLSTADIPGNGKFITNNLDWRNPSNPNLWQGLNGVNNPCPSGYRLPTAAEWSDELASWVSQDAGGSSTSPLRLIMSGSRYGTLGTLNEYESAYWSSTVSGTGQSFTLRIQPLIASVVGGVRANGNSVRCIKDIGGAVVNPIGSINCNSGTTVGTLYKDSIAVGVTFSIPYTGGNGSAHMGQVVQSTGVTGLTATLVPGNFANGNGTLTYQISGRASTLGNATFAINIGGLQCSRYISVILGPGSVAGLDSAGTTHNGSLVRGTAAVGAGFSIPYTGGNGGTFAAQSIESTGVLGLTASIGAGTFNVGSGTLQFSISGTPATAGTVIFTVNIGGRNCIVIRTVAPPPGTLTGLNCVAVDSTGLLQKGVAATATSTISYNGANAGTYSGQSVASTGVTGLTASLQAGVLADGSGTLTFSITGTPGSAGVASFAISIGGQSCVLSRTVDLPPGLLSELLCATAVSTGTLVSGVQSSGVAVSISYLGGNGGRIASQTVASTGVTGLSAVLTPGVLANGAGTLSFQITGTPSSAGTASFSVVVGGLSCSFSMFVAPQVGSILSLSCAATDTTGVLVSGLVATGVSSTVRYTGGDGGMYAAQSIPSSGVTGLTATLSAGQFQLGDGTLTLNITGTPSAAGIASFAINIGGQTCILQRSVALRNGVISVLYCASPDFSDIFTEGELADSVLLRIIYDGGNGGSYSALSVPSTGITGLTATLAAGNFARGLDTLSFIVTGIPANAGTANFALNIGGQSCTVTFAVVAKASYRQGTVHCSGGKAELQPITSAGTGRIWMDRNLGATRRAVSQEDASGWGDLYQWGRGADGHQCRKSAVRSGALSSLDQPGHGDFILPDPNLKSDWRNPQNGNLWQGENGINNPCPIGYRVPTLAEWTSEITATNQSFSYFNSLFLPHAGYRSFDQNRFDLFEGTHAFYWTSTVSTQTSGFSTAVYFNSSTPKGLVSEQPRGYGFAVRCIKD